MEKVYKCYICLEHKTAGYFHADKGRKLGVSSHCKDCSTKRAQHKKYLKQYAEDYKNNPKNALKLSARKEMSSAIRKGILKMLPCEVCGERKTEGHHTDYKKALDVIWLCDLHHSQLHRGIIKI